MKSNLLINKIKIIQKEYKELLSTSIPKLDASYVPEVLDEINLFWVRHIDVVQLYLKTQFYDMNSYVFTGATYMDFDDNEHLPFLLVGKKHIIDDPLSKYSEICNKMSIGHDLEILYNQIKLTAQDNFKILDNIEDILILPMRLLNQSNGYDSLLELGEQFFINLFNGIDNLSDYFEKCNSIEDILYYARSDIGEIIMFSEEDDKSLPFIERYNNAIMSASFMIDLSKPDSHNFYMLVYGYIQQALDIIVSCIEYNLVPFIRYPVAFHYVSSIFNNVNLFENVDILKYKLCMAFVIYNLCDKEELSTVSTEVFLRKIDEYNFDEKLFLTLKKHGINEKNFLNHMVSKFVVEELKHFYDYLKKQ